MTDKRSTQTTLPLVFEPKDYKGLIKQNWQITFARQSNIGVYGKRIIGLVLSEIRKNDYQPKPCYQFRVSNVVKASEVQDKNRAYAHCKKALLNLVHVVWEFEDAEKKIYEPKQLVSTEATIEDNGYAYGYRDGIITMVFNKTMHKLLVEIAHYSSFELEPYMKFKSWYSTRLWEFFSAFKDTGKWYVNIDEYRKLMDCEKKYKITNHLIEKTTSEPLEEFKGTDFEGFVIEKVFARFSGHGRPPVIGLNFIFGKAKTTHDKIEEWKQYSEAHKRCGEALIGVWKVSESVFFKHAPRIGLKRLNELIYQWQVMDSDPKTRIKNRAAYCNKVLKKENEDDLKN